MKKAIFLLSAFICIGSICYAANEVSGNQQNHNIVVNVNVQQDKTTPPGVGLMAENTHSLGFGISSPIFGKEHNIIRDGELFTKKLTGINWLLGYTWRHYLGDGLPQVGGAAYWEVMTISIIVPFAGIGYEYRFNDTIRIGIGFPDVLSARISL